MPCVGMMLVLQSAGELSWRAEPEQTYLWHLPQGGLGPYWEHLARLGGLSLSQDPSNIRLVGHPSQPQVAGMRGMLQWVLRNRPFA